ncbi:hypothetical protein GCM10023165_36610 [Variovorax defluvii]|uniref:Uncharacterized protein n=1 Tax=Variovorax defluvii TaxID=913761 RepID=A0ABP8I213_9BURK
MPEQATTPEKSPRFLRGMSPTIYVEGMSQLMVGFPNSRMLWHSFVAQDPGGEETRQIACELIIPTAAMVDTARMLITHLAANKAQLEATGAEWLKRTADLLASLEPIPGASTGVTGQKYAGLDSK